MKFVFAAAMLMASGSIALAEDDAAVALCETLIKSELIAPKSYERVSSYVEGLTVKVAYDAANQYNAPLRESGKCKFKKDKFGDFILDQETNIEADIAEMKQLAAAPIVDESDRKQRLIKAGEIQKRSESKLKHAILRETLAMASGEYPIPASKTALK
ncbi:hypothetical protein ACXIUS_29735 [Bosea thiooxidans]